MKNYIREGNILLTIIDTAGFGICYDKIEQRFKLYDKNTLLNKDEKKCKCLRDISKIKRRK